MVGLPRMTALPTFRSDDGTEVQFYPVHGYSEFRTHKVIVEGELVGYLTEGTQPDGDTASWWAARRLVNVA